MNVTANSLDRSLKISDEDDWPEESSFRVDRWERGYVKENSESLNNLGGRRESSRFGSRRDASNIDGRPMPRSSRRRQM